MRVRREIIVGLTYHLIWRFVDRRWYVAGDAERSQYLRLLGNALARTDWLCTSYALMSNHIHLSAIAGNEALERWTKRVNSPFVRWINERHGLLGSMMADRAKAHGVAQGRECQLVAYIHNNPVRAGLVAHARESSWTSHRYYAGLASPPSWLHVALQSKRTGIDVGSEFDKWVDQTPGESREIELRAIRKAARKRGAVEVATPSGSLVPLVGRPFAHIRPEPMQVLRIAAEVTGVAIDVLRSRQKSAQLSLARALVIHAGSRAGVTGADIAASLGISPGRVSQIRGERLPDVARPLLSMTLRRLEAELGLELNTSPSGQVESRR